jgi:hypothetical protein
MRLEGLGQLKNPMTSSGIEPAAFRLVVKHGDNAHITVSLRCEAATCVTAVCELRSL